MIGEPVDLNLAGARGGSQRAEALQVRFGHKASTFRLYTDGRVVVNDGVGGSTQLRVSRWPIVRGSHRAALDVELTRGRIAPATLAWHQRPSD